LATDKFCSVRHCVALNPNTTKEILQQLAFDKDSSVRSRVAENLNTPLETLQQLAIDKDPDVRAWVIQNPNKTQIIERLVFMTDYQQEAGKK
jgi:hypothetical protein